MSGIQLIVGLGNPGEEYEHTRHNAGAWFAHACAAELQTQLKYVDKFQGFHGIARTGATDCHILIPQTYMNLSGRSVKAVAAYYKIPPSAILVAHDEIDLPVATIRLKL